jgi:hypothetical protein
MTVFSTSETSALAVLLTPPAKGIASAAFSVIDTAIVAANREISNITVAEA